jgi:hypothetical protein
LEFLDEAEVFDDSLQQPNGFVNAIDLPCEQTNLRGQKNTLEDGHNSMAWTGRGFLCVYVRMRVFCMCSLPVRKSPSPIFSFFELTHQFGQRILSAVKHQQIS